MHLKSAIVILDEAHNVEDICRDAASFDFTEVELVESHAHLRGKCKLHFDGLYFE